MWEFIRANKRKSVFLIVGLAALLGILGAAIGNFFFPADPTEGLFLGVFVAMIIWTVMVLASVLGGERILLATAGAHEVQRNDAPQLYNVVEEMKIASGLPALPRVFIIDSAVPNAFAVGLKPERAAVAVTTGLLSKLNRDELQGVIGHEIGHISNRDTLFMTLAGVTVGAVVILADLFLRGLWFSSVSRRRSSRDGGQGTIIILVISIVLAILAPLLAQILYFACSRRREYLADASSAQYTRYPEGLASALEKIEASQSEKFATSRALAPMYIVNPLAASGRGRGLFSTHPPTEERIRILRGMTRGSSLEVYENAYRELHHGQRVIGTMNLIASKEEGIRAASPESAAHDPQRNWRHARDTVHRVSGYGSITCSCGVKIKIPPDFERKEIKCPRCGREHMVPQT